MITLENVSKKFQSTTAVKDLSFSLKSGSCTALLGPNGCGKTTTLHIIANLLPQTSGTITFDFPTKEVKENIGFLPQFPSFFTYMTPKEYLSLMGNLTKIDSKILPNRIDEVLTLVGLSADASKKIGGFSGGMKQRLGIAQAILHKPKLLLLDEPVSALDPIGRREVINILETLKKHTTILFSTHILPDAEELSDYYVVMKKGQKKAEGTLEDLRSQFEEPVISIRTKENIENWLEGSSNFQVKTKNSPTHFLFNCQNIELARHDLLNQILSKNVSLTDFSVGGSSLEELFLKVMNDE